MRRIQMYAILPAAGVSARMGRHKLLLPWGERTIIEQTIACWQASQVGRIVVVARKDDVELIAPCGAAGVEVVIAAVPPLDMKASVLLALEHIAASYDPAVNDAWLLAPADLPQLSPAAINAVIAGYNHAEPTIVALSYNGRRGHPTLLPWGYRERVAALSPHEGINALLSAAPAVEVTWHDDSIMRDVDTPGDYAAAVACCFQES